MTDLDLDRIRAARREALKKTPTITFGGETFKLPIEVPWEVVALASSDNYGAAVEALLGDSYERFAAHGPAVEDVRELIDRLPALYGMTLGESRASGGSSPNGSRRSRPTSPGSTRT